MRHTVAHILPLLLNKKQRKDRPNHYNSQRGILFGFNTWHYARKLELVIITLIRDISGSVDNSDNESNNLLVCINNTEPEGKCCVSKSHLIICMQLQGLESSYHNICHVDKKKPRAFNCQEFISTSSHQIDAEKKQRCLWNGLFSEKAILGHVW